MTTCIVGHSLFSQLDCKPMRAKDIYLIHRCIYNTVALRGGVPHMGQVPCEFNDTELRQGQEVGD